MELDSVNTVGQSNQVFCLECGATMLETNRSIEGKAVYIWYACNKSNCNGSWLEKISIE